ncbi:hypothetical protein BC828DRAFT_64371 [Blastocladiella britannica]|nr:hypothetical protein BC828DRAFT_64371 [Blastocladiella britannica]
MSNHNQDDEWQSLPPSPSSPTNSTNAPMPDARRPDSAYTLDAAHVPDRIVRIGRMPTRESRRLHALFGNPTVMNGSSSTSDSPPVPSPPPPPSHVPLSPRVTPPGTTTATPQTQQTQMPNDHDTLFECNICLDTASEPVVTLCGHLFCWPCLEPWFRSCARRNAAITCPVCKSGSGPGKTIPIFSRGRERRDPRTVGSSSSDPTAGTAFGGGDTGLGHANGTAPSANPSAGTPGSNGNGDGSDRIPRPSAQRSEPVQPLPQRNRWGGVHVGAMMFPGLFGVTFNFGGGGPAAADDALGADVK